MSDSPREKLRAHWDERYATFSLDESGCLGAGAGLSRMIYRAKEQGLLKALRRLGLGPQTRFRVLDMGCGFGYFAGFYRRKFPHASYTGVDISERAIGRARDTMPGGEFFADDVVSWRHPAHARFDVIQAIDVLQLLMDDAAFDEAVRNIAAHLADDGVLLLLMVFSDAPSRTPYNRLRSRASFDALLDRLGLVVSDELRMYYWLVDGGPTNRILRAIFARIGAGALYLVDRAAMRVGLENRHTDHVLSRARLLFIRRAASRGATDPRNTASGS